LGYYHETCGAPNIIGVLSICAGAAIVTLDEELLLVELLTD
jgi:predicted RNA-binding protein with PUA-like domain